MADSTTRNVVERLIVKNSLPALLGCAFTKRGIGLSWGEFIEFDAVSEDGTVIVCVSTSCSRTAGGRTAIGKIHKIKADALYLLSAKDTKRRVLVFTDRGMFDHFSRERQRGRFPNVTEIELLHIELPADLAAKVKDAAAIAASEVTPIR